MAISRWRVRGFHGDVVLVQRRHDGAPDLPDGGVPLTADAAMSQVDGWFPDGWGQGLDTATLAEIASALGEEPIFRHDAEARRRLKDVVVRALRSGRLLAARVRLPAPSGLGPEEQEERRPERARREETAWLEIVLTTDDDPPRPVAFKRYSVELPNGSVREGQLDARGMARLSGIDPGTCQVSFPDFDGKRWRRA
jgi:hypothetical protein